MMLKSFALLSLLILTGCAPYVRGMVGMDQYTREDVAHIEAGGERRINEQVVGYCAWLHTSSPSHGWPRNNKPEPMLGDVVGCGLQIGGL